MPIESFMPKTPAGWKCKWCGRSVTGLATDAIDHAVVHHHIPASHVAMDREGHIVDTRGISLADLQKAGAI